MDAFDIANIIKTFWTRLGMPISGTSVNKIYNNVPVYVKIDDILVQVDGVNLEDNKIVLNLKL